MERHGEIRRDTETRRRRHNASDTSLDHTNQKVVGRDAQHIDQEGFVVDFGLAIVVLLAEQLHALRCNAVLTLQCLLDHQGRKVLVDLDLVADAIESAHSKLHDDDEVMWMLLLEEGNENDQATRYNLQVDIVVVVVVIVILVPNCQSSKVSLPNSGCCFIS
jgi:hypothetical protein